MHPGGSVALIVPERKHSSSSTVYFFVQTALTGKPAGSVGAQAATETQFSVSAAKGAIDGLESKASGFREAGPRNPDSVFGT